MTDDNMPEIFPPPNSEVDLWLLNGLRYIRYYAKENTKIRDHIQSVLNDIIKYNCQTVKEVVNNPNINNKNVYLAIEMAEDLCLEYYEKYDIEFNISMMNRLGCIKDKFL